MGQVLKTWRACCRTCQERPRETSGKMISMTLTGFVLVTVANSYFLIFFTSMEHPWGIVAAARYGMMNAVASYSLGSTLFSIGCKVEHIDGTSILETIEWRRDLSLASGDLSVAIGGVYSHIKANAAAWFIGWVALRRKSIMAL